jgi:diaminopimelate epimerase
MVIEFVKMHGLGNDFIVVENIEPMKHQPQQMAQRLCCRNTGIGADGLILVKKSAIADLRMQIFNSDGSEAEMCGNGIRCFAKYAYERKIVSKTEFTVETLAGIMKPQLQLGAAGLVEMVRVDMGAPSFDGKLIPLAAEAGPASLNFSIDIEGSQFTVSSVLVGVPHTMVFVPDISKVDVSAVGPAIERHPFFPKKTNVNFVEIVNGSHIKMRTWERGAGQTLACGTGACASVVAGTATARLAGAVSVELALGRLFIEWNQEEGKVFMTGPAEEVFYGFAKYLPLQ